jgi:hypothetical protein
MRYEIRVNGNVVNGSNRIDHATNKYESLTLREEQEKVLVDTKNGNVLQQKRREVAVQGKQAHRMHHNGDAVATYLQDRPIESVTEVARAMRSIAVTLTRPGKRGPVHLLSPSEAQRDATNIETALQRALGTGEYVGKANPGSGRMSLGLMIRKYAKMGVSLPGAQVSKVA